MGKTLKYLRSWKNLCKNHKSNGDDKSTCIFSVVGVKKEILANPLFSKPIMWPLYHRPSEYLKRHLDPTIKIELIAKASDGRDFNSSLFSMVSVIATPETSLVPFAFLALSLALAFRTSSISCRSRLRFNCRRLSSALFNAVESSWYTLTIKKAIQNDKEHSQYKSLRYHEQINYDMLSLF